eukprot:823042-Pyramimonas_sp.AAC.1
MIILTVFWVTARVRAGHVWVAVVFSELHHDGDENNTPGTTPPENKTTSRRGHGGYHALGPR